MNAIRIMASANDSRRLKATGVDLFPRGIKRREREAMGTKAGLWIDHRKAVIVTVSEKGEETGLIVSKVEKQLRRSGDSPLKGPYEARQVPSDDRRQRALTGHLNIYYQAVIASLHDAESILIFGPGEAKNELQKRLEECNIGARIAGVEAADKMTDRQIAAKVRKRFFKSDLPAESK